MLRKMSLVFMAVSLLLTLYAVTVLPSVVPTHFNLRGEPDAYGSKFLLLMLPIVMVGVYLLMTYLPKLDPYAQKVRERMETVRTVRDLTVISFALLNAVIVLATFRGRLEVTHIGLVVALLMVLLGNYLPRLPHNWFVGVRTPWTLASEKVWRRTHRVLGVLFVLYGLSVGVSSFLSPVIMVGVIVGGALLITVGSVIYSYVLFKREEG